MYFDLRIERDNHKLDKVCGTHVEPVIQTGKVESLRIHKIPSLSDGTCRKKFEQAFIYSFMKYLLI